jgi:hypothetical protein
MDDLHDLYHLTIDVKDIDQRCGRNSRDNREGRIVALGSGISI